MPPNLIPLSIPRDERKDYRYEGPEIIYTFWAKPRAVSGDRLRHRTPIMTSPVMAVKTLTVKHWDTPAANVAKPRRGGEAAHGPAPLARRDRATTVSVLDRKNGVICPHCGRTAMVNLGKARTRRWN